MYKKVRLLKEKKVDEVGEIKREDIVCLDIEANTLHFKIDGCDTHFVISRRAGGSFTGNAFYLSPLIEYIWKVVKDEEEGICLYLEKKIERKEDEDEC